MIRKPSLKLRAGTQTLIQALQAIPWANDDQDNDEDTANQDTTDPESDEEDKPGMLYPPVSRKQVCLTLDIF